MCDYNMSIYMCDYTRGRILTAPENELQLYVAEDYISCVSVKAPSSDDPSQGFGQHLTLYTIVALNTVPSD